MSNARTLASLIDDTNTRIKIPSGYGLDFVNYGEEESPNNTATDVTRNKLDDYEEGIWTPAVSSNSGTATSYTDLSGKYTKIGNLIYIEGMLRPTNGTFGNGSSYSTITGIPFTGASTQEGAGSAINTSNYNVGGNTTVYSGDLYIFMDSSSASANAVGFSCIYYE